MHLAWDVCTGGANCPPSAGTLCVAQGTNDRWPSFSLPHSTHLMGERREDEDLRWWAGDWEGGR